MAIKFISGSVTCGLADLIHNTCGVEEVKTAEGKVESVASGTESGDHSWPVHVVQALHERPASDVQIRFSEYLRGRI